MSDISLTASMRTNLLALQNTQSLVNRTQERLSTGLKVNSALDNASSYYTARSLNNRASDLSSLLDSMGQGVQTIKAANEGIEAITSFVEQAKAVANSARDTNDETSRVKYMEQFNEILEQIDTLAKDSSYKGINLLANETLTVTFNESIKDPSKVEIKGVDASSTGLGLSKAEGWVGSTDDVTLTDAQKYAAIAKVYDGSAIEIEPEDATNSKPAITFTVSNDYYPKSENFDPTVVQAYMERHTGTDEDAAKTAIKAKIDTALDAWAAGAGKEKADAAIEAAKAEVGASQMIEAGNESLSASLEKVSEAINKLRDYASTFGNYNTIVQTRQDFTQNLINVLTEGADNLTLADMNEESANMLALQTRQQLGVNSLSLASQAAQSVLSLF